MSKIPAFIINYNRLEYPKAMCEYLAQPETGCEPIILDNNSDYPPLLEWYKNCPFKVERLEKNYGNCALWNKEAAILDKHGLTGDFILSDSDLDLSEIPTDFLKVMQGAFEKYPWCDKCGFSLKISDLPDTPIAKQARGWENLNWSPHAKLDDKYYKAPVDTTFALYKNTRHDFDTCIRTAPPYQAKHIPWYIDLNNVPEDEMYYYQSIGRDFNHYSIQIKNMINK